MNKEKVKVSRREFAEVLYYWLSQCLAKQAIKETARDLDFKIESDEDSDKILQELFALNMWLVVRACERVFEDEDKRNECLDIFHHLVYERRTEETEKGFGKWMTSMGAKYIEYTKAMETEHPSTPLWVLAKVVNKNLFGELREDPFLQPHIGAYVGITAKHLEELIGKYDIE